MRKLIDFYYYAIRAFLAGEDWETAKIYANNIVKGWKSHEDETAGPKGPKDSGGDG